MRRFILAARVAAAALALVGSGATPAEAVVIATGDGSGNTTAPAGNPGWAYMARLGNASAVYLGDRWMITANHVSGSAGSSPVTFTDGRVFNGSVGSDIQLSNPTALNVPITAADLRMFRLAADPGPGLPALPIVTAAPAAGTNAMLIGAGRNRGPNLIGWTVSSTFVWTQTPLPSANVRGFALDPNLSQMRWGTSFVAAGGSAITTGNGTDTVTFATSFNSFGSPNSAQAVLGDSGGGVFQFVNGSWQLAGVIDAVQSTVSGQPLNTAVFGNNQTLSADLSQYRAQIESILSKPEPLWQNQVNHFDVARSGSVNARDVLLLVNRLQKQNGKGGPLSGAPTALDPLVDVNGDGVFDINDIHQLINALLGSAANPTPSATSLASPNVTLVAEPSTGMLALLGILLVGLARRVMIARRQR